MRSNNIKTGKTTGKKTGKNISKRGQVHMSETIAVLFIFFVLIMFGMIFYYKFSQVALLQEQEEMLQKEAVDATLKALFMPELICSNGEAETEDNCVDMQKLIYVKDMIDDHRSDYYFNIFGYANITVFKLGQEAEKFTIYDFPKPNWTKKEPTFFVINLRDQASPLQYNFGYMAVEVYS